jgi:molybdate transport repressor ModE-like protein
MPRRKDFLNRLDRITLKQLRALEAVARDGSISSAAQRLGLTAPAVHSQLKTLEDAMETKLLLRDGSERNVPTQQGESLLEAFAVMRNAMERAILQISALDRGQIGAVVLGVVSTGKYFAPRIVAEYQKHAPEVEVILKVGNREEIIKSLSMGELDLCIMGRPPRAPKVDALSLADHPHVIIASATHPLVGQEIVTPEALLEEKFLMREFGSGTRIMASRYLDDLGGGRQVNMLTMPSNETIKQAVMADLGIALISAHTIGQELASGVLETLNCPGLPLMRRWYLITAQDRTLSKAAQDMRAWLESNAARIIERG